MSDSQLHPNLYCKIATKITLNLNFDNLSNCSASLRSRSDPNACRGGTVVGKSEKEKWKIDDCHIDLSPVSTSRLMHKRR